MSYLLILALVIGLSVWNFLGMRQHDGDPSAAYAWVTLQAAIIGLGLILTAIALFFDGANALIHWLFQ